MPQLSPFVKLSHQELLEISPEESKHCKCLDFICPLIRLLIACNADINVSPVRMVHFGANELFYLSECTSCHSLHVGSHKVDVFEKIVIV